MRLELDENLHPRLVALLQEDGQDVEAVRSEGLEGVTDDDLFDIARNEARTLVTLDLDFSNPLRFPTEGTAGTVVIRVPRPVLSVIEETVGRPCPNCEMVAFCGGSGSSSPAEFASTRQTPLSRSIAERGDGYWVGLKGPRTPPRASDRSWNAVALVGPSLSSAG